MVAGLGLPFTTVTPAIFKGKMHFQQISVIGLTNRPTHLAWAGESHKIRKMDKQMKHSEPVNRIPGLFDGLGEFGLIICILTDILALIIKKGSWINDPTVLVFGFIFSDALVLISLITGLFSRFIKWG